MAAAAHRRDHRAGHHRARLPGALPEPRRRGPADGARGHGRRAARPAGLARRRVRQRPRLARPGRIPGAGAGRGGRARHRAVGRAGPGGRAAAGRAAGRHAGPGPRLQQQRPGPHPAGTGRRRGAGTARRGRVHRAEGPGRPGPNGRRPRRGPPGQDRGGRRRDAGRGLQPGAQPGRGAGALPGAGRGGPELDRGAAALRRPGRSRPAGRGPGHPGHARGELLRPAGHVRGHPLPGLRPGDAGPDADRRGDRVAAGRRDRRRDRPADVLAPVPRGLRAPAPGHPDRAVARVAGLGPSRAGPPLRGPGRPPAPARTSPATAWNGTRPPWRTSRASPLPRRSG